MPTQPFATVLDAKTLEQQSAPNRTLIDVVRDLMVFMAVIPYVGEAVSAEDMMGWVNGHWASEPMQSVKRNGRRTAPVRLPLHQVRVWCLTPQKEADIATRVALYFPNLTFIDGTLWCTIANAVSSSIATLSYTHPRTSF